MQSGYNSLTITHNMMTYHYTQHDYRIEFYSFGFFLFFGHSRSVIIEPNSILFMD